MTSSSGDKSREKEKVVGRDGQKDALVEGALNSQVEARTSSQRCVSYTRHNAFLENKLQLRVVVMFNSY